MDHAPLAVGAQGELVGGGVEGDELVCLYVAGGEDAAAVAHAAGAHLGARPVDVQVGEEIGNLAKHAEVLRDRAHELRLLLVREHHLRQTAVGEETLDDVTTTRGRRHRRGAARDGRGGRAGQPPRGALEAARRRAPLSANAREPPSAAKDIEDDANVVLTPSIAIHATPPRRARGDRPEPNAPRHFYPLRRIGLIRARAPRSLGVLVAADAPAGRRWSRIPHSTLAHVGIATARLNVRFRFKSCPIHDGRVSARDGRLAPVHPRFEPPRERTSRANVVASLRFAPSSPSLAASASPSHHAGM